MQNQDIKSTARLDLDLERPGKNFGHIALAQSTNISAWGELHIPVVSINGGPGPTVLLLGGNHGDEYEGPILLLKLVEEIEPSEVMGRIIVIPRISGEASAAGRRLWSDGTNFNRAFPGDADGSVTARLADFMTRVLFPQADAVVDVHSGGRSMVFAPMATIHVPEDPVQRARMLDAASTWMTDLCYVQLFAADGAGLLGDEAMSMGKTVATTELGGGGMTTAGTLTIGNRGLRNMLRHFGSLRGAVQTREELGLEPTRYVEIAGPPNYLRARERGLFEPSVEPGESVVEGQRLGRMRFPDRPERASEEVPSPYTGVVCVLRAMPNSEVGDCLAVVGRIIDLDEIG